MSKDFGQAGGKAGAPTKEPAQTGEPDVGFSDPSKGGKQLDFVDTHGFGGTTKPAR